MDDLNHSVAKVLLKVREAFTLHKSQRENFVKALSGFGATNQDILKALKSLAKMS